MMSNSKVMQQSFWALAGLTFMSIFSPQMVQAATLVNVSLNEANLNDPNIGILEICPEFTCQPNQVFFANNVNTPIITLLNNTGFAIGGFSLQLLGDAVFEQATSQLFPNVTLFNNNTAASFSGGILGINQAATFVIDSGVDKVAFSAIVTSVPESSPVLGLLALGALGSTIVLKKKLQPVLRKSA